MKLGGGEKCARCVRLVYHAERVQAIGKAWHKRCFKCYACNTYLDSGRMTDHDGELLCKTCYAKAYGPKGYGFGGGHGDRVLNYTQ